MRHSVTNSTTTEAPYEETTSPHDGYCHALCSSAILVRPACACGPRSQARMPPTPAPRCDHEFHINLNAQRPFLVNLLNSFLVEIGRNPTPTKPGARAARTPSAARTPAVVWCGGSSGCACCRRFLWPVRRPDFAGGRSIQMYA